MTAPALPSNLVRADSGLRLQRTDSPDARRAESTDLLTVWEDCTLCATGWRAMSLSIERYLPRTPREKPLDYQRRAKFTAFYNAFGRTVRGMAGLPFRTAPTVGDNVNAVVREHVEDIDGEGNHLDIFARRFFERVLKVGCGGILVDGPSADDGLSRLQEESLGVRPYWHAIDAEHVLNWRYTRFRGRKMLSMLVLEESADVEVGEFLLQQQTRYLVYRLALPQDSRGEPAVTIQRYTELKAAEKNAPAIITPDADPRMLRNIAEIPFSPLVLGEQTSELTSMSPLLDLLDCNLQHFRVSSDRNWLMHLSCVPVPVRKGGGLVNPASKDNKGEDAQAKVEPYGPNVLMKVGPDGDFYYREPAGTAFVPTGEELKELERRMASLGLAFLASDTRAAETAESKRIDAAVQNSTLAACADSLDDCIERALSFHAQFIKVAVRKGNTWSGGEWSTNRDYGDSALSPQMLDSYSRMEQAGQLTLRTLWRIMDSMGALPDEFDADDEERDLQQGGDMTVDESQVPPINRQGALPTGDGTATGDGGTDGADAPSGDVTGDASS